MTDLTEKKITTTHISADDRIAALEIACQAEREAVERAIQAGNDGAAEINRQRVLAAENRLAAARLQLQTGETKAVDSSETARSVEHPCDRWAKASGFGSWALALSSMNAGRVVAGPLAGVQLPASTSMIRMHLFLEVLQKEGLHSYVPVGGSMVVVGYEKDFPPDMLADQEKQTMEMAARMRPS